MNHALAACAAVLLTLVALPARAGILLEGDTCRQVFDNPKAEHIACATGFRLDPTTRERLANTTFGLLSDLACSTRLTARRSEIIGKVRAGGDVALPPQSVACRLISGGDPVNVRFNLAPVLRLDHSGKAVDARLGVRDVTGIPEPLATAVADFLNSDATLRKTIVGAANEIIPNLPRR